MASGYDKEADTIIDRIENLNTFSEEYKMTLYKAMKEEVITLHDLYELTSKSPSGKPKYSVTELVTKIDGFRNRQKAMLKAQLSS